jgi:uncharacterized protein (DUF427 family)
LIFRAGSKQIRRENAHLHNELLSLSGAVFGNRNSGTDVFQDMAKAVWNGILIAESDSYETVEGNVYFPESALKREYFRPSSTTSTCPWKGQARYYSLFSDGQENPDAAWYYPDPKPAARKIKNHVAFWRGVEVEK